MPYWDERVAEMAKSYPDIDVDKYHIDILTAQFVLNPDRFDVVPMGDGLEVARIVLEGAVPEVRDEEPVDLEQDGAVDLGSRRLGEATVDPRRGIEHRHLGGKDPGGHAHDGERADLPVEIGADLHRAPHRTGALVAEPTQELGWVERTGAVRRRDDHGSALGDRARAGGSRR